MKGICAVRLAAILFFVFAMFSPGISNGVPPLTINYQGYLTNSGNPVNNATQQMRFSLHDAPSGGTELWNETQTVNVQNGIYNVMLGSVTAFPVSVNFNTQYYLEIAVYNSSSASLEILAPRQKLASAGSAINSDMLDGKHSTDLALSAHAHPAADITGTIPETKIDPVLARDSEVAGAYSPLGHGHSSLSVNGANCAAGNYPLGVDASGNAESCTADDDTPDSDAEVPDSITVAGSVTSAATINIRTTPSTVNGVLSYDPVTDRIGVGDGTVTDYFQPDIASTVCTNGIAGIADNGTITCASAMTETDPTVLSSVKDGVAWSELSGIPAGFADGVDHGITSESDPSVNALGKAALSCTGNQIPKYNGANWSCATDSNTTYSAGAGLTLSGTTFSLSGPVNLTASTSVLTPVLGGTNTGSGYGVMGVHETSGNYGYLGSSSYGAKGYSASGGGVYGEGATYGLYGYSADGKGAYGGSWTAEGVYGFSSSGVAGFFSSPFGYGLVVNSGNVGLGISAPRNKLHIQENVDGLTFPLKLDNQSGITGSATGILFSAGFNDPVRGKGGLVYEYTGTWNRGSFHVLQEPNGNPSTPTLSNAVVTITNSGNVGIGTKSPNVRLDVNDMARVKGSTWPTTGSGMELGYNYALHKGYIQVYNRDTGTWGDLYLGESEVFTNQIYAKNAYGDSIRLGGDSTGSDLELTIWAPDARNYISLWNATLAKPANLGAGELYTSVIHITSDERLKKNITTIDSALEKVAGLRGVEYEWKKEEFPQRGFSDGRKIGLIAQEVEKVLPELVDEDVRSGYKTVEYTNIIAVLVEAVKELKKENEDLKARVQKLETEGRYAEK